MGREGGGRLVGWVEIGGRHDSLLARELVTGFVCLLDSLLAGFPSCLLAGCWLLGNQSGRLFFCAFVRSFVRSFFGLFMFSPSFLHSLIHSSIHSIPFHSVPLRSVPFRSVVISRHSIPFHSMSFHPISFHFKSFGSISFHLISFHVIARGSIFPFSSFHSIPFHVISFPFGCLAPSLFLRQTRTSHPAIQSTNGRPKQPRSVHSSSFLAFRKRIPKRVTN